MDERVPWQKLKEFIQKYRYAALVLLAGLFLMLLPGGKEEIVAQEPIQEISQPLQKNFASELSEILSKIEGAGKVQVFLSQAAGEETIYQTDEDIASGNIRLETVILTDGDRAEAGLVRQVNPPVYLGAIVLCQGADSAAIRLSVTQAVANATGLGTDQISVLKMK